MDSTDIKILRLLQNNARVTASEIAGIISLSVPACAERLKKLESSGVIKQYTAIIDPAYLKKSITAVMSISLERPRYAEKFIEAINSEEDILECHYLTGDFDYLLKIITHDTVTLEKLLTRIKSVQGVQKTRTSVVLSTLKNKYSVSP
ncbi:MAG: Lrp/AsnC family transcriptional regulator [Oscillospiraceae bacterium]